MKTLSLIALMVLAPLFSQAAFVVDDYARLNSRYIDIIGKDTQFHNDFVKVYRYFDRELGREGVVVENVATGKKSVIGRYASGAGFTAVSSIRAYGATSDSVSFEIDTYTENPLGNYNQYDREIVFVEIKKNPFNISLCSTSPRPGGARCFQH